MNHTTPFANLTPDVVLDAIESAGYAVSGSLLALNSYENRVYQAGLDDGQFIVAKFYRPNRWDKDTIQEEHDFTRELAGAEIPVVAPLPDANGQTLQKYADYYFALYPRQGGRPPELDDPEHLRWLGRFLGRIHAIGATQHFQHRPSLTVQRLGYEAMTFLLEHGYIPGEIEHNYRLAAETLLQNVDDIFSGVGPFRQLRLHGDCHPGNILWTEQGPHFVDLDDCMTGPAIQDLWMLLSGNHDDMQSQFRLIHEGYVTFFDFDPVELHLVEALRALRMLHYSAWLAARWHDPAFPYAFPWFNTPRYWEDQLNTLREQAERLNEPAITLT